MHIHIHCIPLTLCIRSFGVNSNDLNQRPKPIDDGECKVKYPLLWPNISG